MKPLKRILSIFLAVVMALAVIPFSAYGEENREDKPDVESDLSYKPTNALGGLLTDEIENNQKDADPNYSIHSLEITGNSANVSITSLGECSVVVGIYEKRNGKMLFSGKAKVEAGEAPKDSVVTVNLNTDAMPDYFFVKAFLLASDNSPLCKNYETFEYTEEFEKFKEKTVNDFDSDRVMNLDKSIDNNFLVLKDDVKLIDPREGANIVVTDDYENGKYVISNADDSITSLKQGDVFYYKYGEGANDYIITKVGSADIDGDAVTITKSETDELTDYFQYAKIDTSSTNVTFDDAGMEEGVTHTRLEENDYQTAALDVGADYSVGDKWTIPKKFDEDLKLDFSIIFKLKFSCKIFIDVSFAYFEATLNYNSDIEGELSGKIEFIDIPLGVLGVDLSNIGLAADVKLSFVMEGAVKIKLKFSLSEAALGFAFDSNTGFINKNKAATVESNPELTDAAELFIGFKLKAEVNVLKQLSASIEARSGLKVKGKLTVIDSSENKHDCSRCIDGIVSFNLKCEFKVKIFSWIENTVTLGELDSQIGKFYYSFDIGFGWGRCPNISYKITVTVKDRDGAPVKEAVVNNDYTTDENGIVVIYLKSGEQKITVVTKGGQTAEKTITVANEARDIEIVINSDNAEENQGGEGNSNASGVMASGYCGAEGEGKNLTWTLYNDGELVIDGSGEMLDYVYDNPSWLSYGDSIRKLTIKNGVTSIGSNAFYDCASLIGVTIPDSVTSIGVYAFNNCTSLTSVIIPSSVTSIDWTAFYYCVSLASITVDKNNQNYSSDEYGVLFNKDKTELIQYPIGNKRTEYSIPDSVTNIGNDAFFHCSSLVSITVDKNNKNYSGDEYGVLFNKDKTELIQYPVGNKRKEYSIPGSVTSIGDHAFFYCSSLTKVTIPNGVTSMGDFAFDGCASLASVTIPGSVTSMGDFAFCDCTSLTSVTIEDGVTSIGGLAFAYCDSLTSVTIPGSVTNISDRAFLDCLSLTSVTIEDGVTSISSYAFSGTALYDNPDNWSDGVLYIDNCLIEANEDELPAGYSIREGTKLIADGAFQSCYSLASVTIPDSVTNIGSYAFSGTALYDNPDNWSDGVLYIDNCLIEANEDELPAGYSIREGTKLIADGAFQSCYSLASVTIPESVTIIGDYAFAGCDSLADVIIGNNVTSIGDGAFAGCDSLTSVTIPDSVTSIGEYAFEDCTSLTSVTIPNSVTSIGYWAFSGCDSLKNVYYEGTEEQWRSVSIGAYNESLTSANITFAKIDTQYASLPSSKPVTKVPTIAIANDDVYKETLTTAEPGMSYVVLTVKDENAEDLLAFDNLLYIDQITATSATITVEFSLREPFEGYKTIWAGADIGDVLVTPVEPSTETPTEPTTTKPTIPEPTEPTTVPTTVPATEPSTVSPTEPSTEPSTVPSTEPTTKPTTEAPSETTTKAPAETTTKSPAESTTVKPSETTTKATAESTTVKPSETTTKTPATEPTTEPTTEAPTEPTTEPMSEPASEPASEPSSELEHEHDYVGVVTKEPTCTEEGVMTYTCSVCGDSYTESIPAKGHVPGDWETVVPPEAGKPGLEQQRCTVCGEVLDEREIPELPGSTGNCVVLPDPDPSTEPEYSLGDVNADGDITASDARIALRISAKLHTPTETEILASDTDKNGSITASDARKILRVSAKLDKI